MKIETEHAEYGVILKLTGELDASTALSVDESLKNLINEGAVNILVDCSCLEYISSAGIGVFIAYLEDISSNNGRVIFFSLNDSVNNVLEMLGIDQIIHICKDRGDAEILIFESKN